LLHQHTTRRSLLAARPVSVCPVSSAQNELSGTASTNSKWVELDNKNGDKDGKISREEESLFSSTSVESLKFLYLKLMVITNHESSTILYMCIGWSIPPFMLQRDQKRSSSSCSS